MTFNKELPKAYNSQDYEDQIYHKWEESGFFNPDVCIEKGICKKEAKTYTIVLPPPNITDKLHLGHGVMIAIEDILIRYYRMNGYRALWVPGTDHAAIATQNVVEKKLLKEENKTRHDLGREKFLEKVWEFVKETQSTILQQIRKSGASLDWSREAFTLDEQRQAAVRKMFIEMYQAGVIYRGERVVNWCPRCQSTLADDEVEYKKTKSKLYWLKYGPFTLATTRPETKLGDTAVAVHPSDKRYKDMIGKEYMIPGVLGEFKVKVIADHSVDPDFGSGAVKVTPSHSFIDSEMALRNNIPGKQIINEEGKMMDNCGKYAGMTTLEARQAILADMEKMDLLDHIDDDYEHNLSVCYRCNTTIEPLPSKQWFVGVDKKLKRLKGKSLKEAAIDVAKKEKVKFTPDRFYKRYLDWMENLHDWCISRQIWFGHRLPVWYKGDEVWVPKEYTELVLTRHALTDWNQDEIIQGKTEMPLDESSIDNLKTKLTIFRDQGFDLIICSPMMRARQTAEIINEELNIPIVIEESLRERDYGVFEGKKVSEIKKDYPEYYKDKINYKIGQAETYNDLSIRAKEFLGKVIKEYPNKKILVISHNAMVRTFNMVMGGEKDIKKLSDYKLPFGEVANYHILDGKYELADWKQDTDSLDTWFSSGMWTFSTLGWPNKTDDLKDYHPTQMLETGYEIITLWVSRMIMMSLFALQEIPFENVYLHGMILDQNGKKMSKSKGNGIDPFDIISKYGADAMRLSLVIGSTPGNDSRLSEDKIAAFRNFTNKLWNIARYIIGSIDFEQASKEIDPQTCSLADAWILDKMSKLIASTRKNIEEYKFSLAGEQMRDFTWNDLADWYVEVSKFEKNSNKDIVLLMILKDLLKLWHPYMPFVTETIWQEIGSETLLMVEQYPEAKVYDQLVKKAKFKTEEFDLVRNVIVAIRNIRAEYQIKPANKIKVIIHAGKQTDLLNEQSNIIKNLFTRIETLEIVSSGNKSKQAAMATTQGVDIIIPLAELVDIDQEKERIGKRLEELDKLSKLINDKLGNGDFKKNAPADIINQEEEKLANYQVETQKLKAQFDNLK
ncbi:MAG: class I tRNA ligase family protein [Candidatus Komeilibacteria bacterium]